MAGLTLDLDKRSITGKKVSTLRKTGIIPVHLYGANTESLSLQAEISMLSRLLTRASTNIPITVSVNGTPDKKTCFVREVQYHPVTDIVIHVDLISVDIEKTITARVPINIMGTSPAVRTMGGTLLQPIESLTVEALPLDIPTLLTLDAELLVDFDTNLYVKDIVVPENVTIINDESQMIASVIAPRVERAEGTSAASTNENEESNDTKGNND